MSLHLASDSLLVRRFGLLPPLFRGFPTNLLSLLASVVDDTGGLHPRLLQLARYVVRRVDEGSARPRGRRSGYGGFGGFDDADHGVLGCGGKAAVLGRRNDFFLDQRGGRFGQLGLSVFDIAQPDWSQSLDLPP